MVFIYWGWDTALAVNEETKDKTRTPGLAAIFSTFILLVTYALVIFSMQAFAGVSTTGNGLGNLDNAGDVLSVQGNAIFGTTGIGPFFLLLLFLMMPQLGRGLDPDHDPADRPDHAVDGGLQGAAHVVRQGPPAVHDAHGLHDRDGRDLDRGVRGDELPVGRDVIADAVIAIGLYIAFYYGLTGFACAWYYRRNLTSSARNLWMQGILPVAGGLILFFLGGWSLWLDYDVAPRTTTPVDGAAACTGRSAARSSSRSSPPSSGWLVYLYCRYDRARPSSRSRP